MAVTTGMVTDAQERNWLCLTVRSGPANFGDSPPTLARHIAGPETCRFLADRFVRPEADENEVTDWLTMLDQTLTEDTHAVGLQQSGLRSQMVPHGRLMPASESAIARVHRIVWESFSEILDEA